jgi:hypothetical protein
MMTRKARLLVIAVAILVLGWTLYQRTYEISAITGVFIALLVWSHYKQGTVMLAAKAFHQKDYERAEELLQEVENPDWLSRNRRGFYEFIYGTIELHKNNYEDAERHFQIASRFPMRNENDKGIVMVQLANLNLRKQDYGKVRGYVEKAKLLNISARVKHIIEKLERELPLKT